MKEPEKIYIYISSGKFLDGRYSTTPTDNPVDKKNEVGYTHTDAFIEKACEYLMDYGFNDSSTIADRKGVLKILKKQ